MDSKSECLDPTMLAELLDGGIDEPVLSELTKHLEGCPACQTVAKTLTLESRFSETFRDDSADRNLNFPPAELLHRIKLIPQVESRAGVEQAFVVNHSVAHQLDDIQQVLAPPQQADEIGRLGHYRILQVLGHGGMGAVFLAEDPKLGRRVALKVMLPRIANIPAARDRFLREAKAAASLKNDHIVTIYQVDEFNNVPFLAMELLQGETLEQSIQVGRRFSIAETIRIARDIARGLTDAHEKGLVHRDIKPGNLWLEQTPDGNMRCKILDFGLARAEVDDVQITQFGTIVGTPAFMAPEQARADRAVDGRADLFSLGCVLYVLCTGDIPFKADTTVGTLMALALNTPVAPNQRNDSVPAELSKFVMQLLEKDPSERTKSAREVTGQLTEMVRSIEGGNANVAMTPQTLLGVSKPIRDSALPVSLPVRKSIGRSLKIATAVVIAALTYIAVVFHWQTPDGRIVRIECNDPSIKLAFQGGELKVTGAYDQPVTLTPGKVDLKITKAQPDGKNFEFETDKLVVRKGELIVLKIEVLDGEVRIVQDGKGTLDSKPLSSSTSLPSSIAIPLESIADINRRAAVWALSVGGNITVDGSVAGRNETTGRMPREIRTIAALPKEPFVVTAVRCQNIEPFDEAGFVHLRELKYLHTLAIEGEFENVTDAAFENLRDCTRLEHLAVLGCGITDKVLAPLKDLPALAFVGISGKPGLTDAAMVSLKNFPALTKLYLNGANLTDDGLQHLTDFRNLQSLGLAGNSGLTDKGLVHVADIKTLVTLDLAATNAGDVTMKRISELPKLTELGISYTSVTDHGLECLQACKELKFVWVMHTSVTAEVVKRFHAALPECRIEYGTDQSPIIVDANGMTN